MFSSFSFLPKVLHELISVYIFMYALIIGAYVYATFYYPYSIRPMSLKYLPQSFVDNVPGIIVILIYGWVGYAIGEWIVIFTLVSFPILISIMVLETLRIDYPDVFNAITFGSLFLTLVFTLLLYQGKIGTFGN